MILRILSSYYFTLECLVLYLLLLFISLSKNQLPPSIALFCVILSGNLFLFFSLQKRKVSRMIPFLAGMISGGIGYSLGLNSFSSILCTMFVYFRTEAFIKDSSLWLEERIKLPIIFYLSSLIVFIFSWIYHYSYMNWILGLVLVFTVLFSLGKFLQQAVTNQTIKNIHGIIGSLAIAVLFSSLVMMILPLIKSIGFKVLGGLINLIAFMASPLFNYVEHINLKEKTKGSEEDIVLKDGTNQLNQSQHTLIHSIPSWTWILLLILSLLITWLIIRKLKSIKIVNNVEHQLMTVEYSSNPETLKIKRRFFHYSAPSEPIRKLIFQLQKYAVKQKVGRLPHETVKEWLKRINIPNQDELINAYDSVRYGKAEIAQNEKYEEVIKEIKGRMKDLEFKNRD